MSPPPSLRDAAYRWIADDVDTADAAELQRVLAAAMAGDGPAEEELADRMAGPLRFGTAGLRGTVRAGPNGMNRAVVVRTTAGVAAWLTAQGHSGGVVVVGRDARHGSEAFADATAAVLAGAGFDARVLPGPLPTPVLAYAVRALGAVAGIQVTASHNPPADNGYKLYDSGGAQIVPPADREIEAAVEAAPPAVSVPREDSWSWLDSTVGDRYRDSVAALPRGTARELRVVATALHGVGAATFRAAMEAAGFAAPSFVAGQSEPDPDFPSVTFPNPEEPGAADALLALAEAEDADLAVALDPDADRCALGVRHPDGEWRMLSGDATGVLLGSHVLSTSERPDPLVATTIVSSSMLGAIASAYGARYAETLTGFKWLVRAGTGLVFAYEEALGLCVDPDSVRDKDGISAAVLACDLAAGLRASGRTLLDALDELAVAHGVHLTRPLTVRVEDLSRIGAMMRALRTGPPAALAGIAVTTEDLLPDADVLRFRGEGPRGDRLRVVVRPSGTEQKLKAYLEVVVPVSSGLSSARRQAAELLDAAHGELSAVLGG